MAEKVLIIEDNEQNLYLFTYLLKQYGYEILSAANGLKGIEMALTHKPKFILLDIQLPDIDGYTTAKKLRSHSPLRHTPIIAVTSYAMVGDREKALDAGCTGYLEKPIDPDKFIEDIQSYLNY